MLVKTFLEQGTTHTDKEHSNAPDYLAILATTIKNPNVTSFTQLNLLPLLTVSSGLHPIAWYLNTYRKKTISLNFLNVSFKSTKDCVLARVDF